MDYRKDTRETCDRIARKFEDDTKDFLERYLLGDIRLFLGKLLKRSRILDIGGGPGRDSLFFKENGFDPLIIDLSEKMVELCRRKGLRAVVMDFEHLDFPSKSFDGVWAYASLLHLPKRRLPDVLRAIRNVLTDGGILFLGMKEGSFEGFLESPEYPGSKRFFALYTRPELEEMLKRDFVILNFSSAEPSPTERYVHFLCRVREPLVQ